MHARAIKVGNRRAQTRDCARKVTVRLRDKGLRRGTFRLDTGGQRVQTLHLRDAQGELLVGGLEIARDRQILGTHAGYLTKEVRVIEAMADALSFYHHCLSGAVFPDIDIATRYVNQQARREARVIAKPRGDELP